MITQLRYWLTVVMAGTNYKSDNDAIAVMCQQFPKPLDYNIRIWRRTESWKMYIRFISKNMCVTITLVGCCFEVILTTAWFLHSVR